jgi:ABC-type nitrate/sulfonate/bicarbonate transport system substrate-binding protein
VGSSDTSKRVGTGKLEFGVSSTVAQTNFLATADGAPFSMIGTDKARAQTGLFYRADSDIQNLPEDLEGGTVAVTSNPFIKRSYDAWAFLTDAPEVEFVEGTEAVQLESLESGEADVVLQTVGDIPDYESALGVDINFDPLYKYAPVYGYTIIANDEFMENNMEYTTRMLEGYSNAMKWTMLNIEDAVQILREEVNPSLQVQELETQANALRISILATNATEGYRENGAAYLNEQAVQETLDVYGNVVEGGSVPDPADAANFEPQENAELATFSDDEWSQIREQTGDFPEFFE